ncbi:hypothetical protein [Puniceibacterium sp. IMCC21224]|uniref:hypothetical protein n=1 Tax=Puniceibacterium sp. IMCC21224 TaxID=1618204 RepID=UPI00064DB232|nr:hypothetical protein [Puniceibacterium sp. IMCC21224]KMK66090.1 hypothetical protein IMCC21224_11936 [Puniceibacterium sp. IMCC21224]
MRHVLISLAVGLFLAGCADGARELQKPVEPLGNFKLGHAIVVAPNIVQGPASRDATADEWIAGVDAALEERFRRYDGESFYHLGVSVEGYVLALPGVPLVFNPKSVLIVKVTVFDDATQKKLNEEPEQITVLEAISPETMVGSGVTQSKARQMELLSANAALKIETWMRKMQKEKGWFGGPEADRVDTEPDDAETTELDPRVQPAATPEAPANAPENTPEGFDVIVAGPVPATR